MTVLEDTYQFIPEQQIILDKSGCGTPPTISPPTTPAIQPISSETCSAIINLNVSLYLSFLEVLVKQRNVVTAWFAVQQAILYILSFYRATTLQRCSYKEGAPALLFSNKLCQ